MNALVIVSGSIPFVTENTLLIQAINKFKMKGNPKKIIKKKNWYLKEVSALLNKNPIM